MADNESIRSPFPTQLSTRPLKLRIYESLFVFNQSVDQVITLLRNMQKFSFADKRELQSFVVEIELARGDMNADFSEHLVDSERFDEGRFSKVVDYIRHSIDDGTLYITVSFKDKTAFSLRYACEMFIVGTDISDWKSGDDVTIREYIRPIPR